jgi:porin
MRNHTILWLNHAAMLGFLGTALLYANRATAQQTTNPTLEQPSDPAAEQQKDRPATVQRTTADSPKGWLERDTMTGDWGGHRTSLEKEGIDLRADYMSESAANPVGGIKQAARYTQQITFGADLDLGHLAGVSDAKIQITFSDRAGKSLSADAIGSQFSVQALFGAGQNFRLSELNYQQDLLHREITLELGWSPIGDNFGNPMVFCYFQNGTICGHANAMTKNSGANNFPTGQWGARVKVSPTSKFYASTGIYQVNPLQEDSDKGFDLSFSGTGVFIPVEFGWLPGQGKGELPGIYKVGGYYNSSSTPDVFTDVNGFSAGLTGAPFATRNGRWGSYVMADQVVYHERPDSPRGLRIGGMVGMGDAATAKYRYFLAGGGQYQGMFPRRDNDFVSLAISYVRNNDRLTLFQEDRNIVAPGSVGVQTYESVIEVDYSVQVAPWFALRPNLQYLINPSGTEKIPNAFVIGLYTRVTF